MYIPNFTNNDHNYHWGILIHVFNDLQMSVIISLDICITLIKHIGKFEKSLRKTKENQAKVETNRNYWFLNNNKSSCSKWRSVGM